MYNRIANEYKKQQEVDPFVFDKDILPRLPNAVIASIVTQEEDEEQWLEDRKHGIGGSEVGSIVGANAYSSARLVYNIKMGLYTPTFSEEAKERMRWGHILEPLVAEEYRVSSGLEVMDIGVSLRHKQHDFARVNVDRIILNEKGEPFGVLECKTANDRLLKDWSEGNVPLSYIYQLQWGMFVTGLEFGALAGLVSNRFFCYEMEYDKELVETVLLPAAKHFWEENILMGIEPEVTGSKADTDYINTISKEQPVDEEDVLITTDDSYDTILLEIDDLKKQKKEVETQIAHKMNQLKEDFIDYTYITTPEHSVTYKKSTRRVVDAKKLEAEFSDVYEQCVKESVSRTLRVKKTREDLTDETF